MTYEGIQHVAFTVDDLAAAQRFYGTTLGLAELDRPPFGIAGLWFGVGGQAIHIAEVQDHQPSRRHHFALQVDDLAAVAEQLTAEGVDVRFAAHTPGAGRQATIRDPAGNTIELNQPER
jgi:catechol 2,3-dioxygenase-like lactoylglutathione lyase family enzyme